MKPARSAGALPRSALVVAGSSTRLARLGALGAVAVVVALGKGRVMRTSWGSWNDGKQEDHDDGCTGQHRSLRARVLTGAADCSLPHRCKPLWAWHGGMH